MQRYYFFDYLKIILTYIGVFIHVGFAYFSIPENPWPIIDEPIPFLIPEMLMVYGHRIRVPLFFIISGFIAKKTIKKENFLESKINKILIPYFILSIPGYYFIKAIYSKWALLNGSQNKGEYFFNFMPLEEGIAPLHLWFLFYLFLYFIFYYMIKNNKQLLNFFKNNINLIIIFFISSFSMKSDIMINHLHTFALDVPTFLYYLIFFIYGTNMCMEKSILTKRNVLFLSFLFLLGSIFNGYFIINPIENLIINKFLIYSTFLIYIISSIRVIIHFSYLYLNKTSKSIKYLADSSFFMYVLNLPFIVFFQWLFVFFNIPLFLKWILITILSIIIPLAIYDYFIRFSFIGTYFHGKRVR
jgi:glucan biosynthesis protein C